MEPVGPFKRMELQEPNFFMRLLGRRPRRNAFVELNNTLAAAGTVTDVGPEAVDEIARRYGTRLGKRFAKDLESLYRSYLHYCLTDKRFSASEIEELAHLKKLLGLSDRDVARIRDDLCRRIYGASVKQAIEDGTLDAEERAFHDRLQSDLGLAEEIASRLFEDAARARVEREVDQAVADQQLSPDEEAELRAIAKSLGVEIVADEKTEQALSRYRLYWLIENGDLPAIETRIHLQRSEKCYAVRRVKWFELRSVTKRIRYAGPTARIKIARGIYFRAGDLAFQPIKEEVLRLKDQGDLYLTNKRIIFVGAKRNTNIRMSRILDFTPYRNGIELAKDAGRNPFFEFSDDIDLFCLLFSRVLKDDG